tara:strand:+ start:453 stop:860 length:408 start_codon:yes stop_codon:yes gene_type:complete
MNNLVRRNRDIFNHVDSMFDDFFGGNLQPYMSARRQANVVNRDEDWQIVFAVPGVDPSEVEVKIDDHVLSVSYNAKNTDNRFSFVSSFSRSWNIDRDVNPDNIQANFKNGVLTITVPKPESKKRVVKTIEVKAMT